MRIEEWNRDENDFSASEDWQLAAESLRLLLSHASFSLKTASTSVASPDRRLTGQEVQSMHSHFKMAGLQVLREVDPYDHQHQGPHPVTRYLPWLENAELAQRVADAWNEVVNEEEQTGVPTRHCNLRLTSANAAMNTPGQASRQHSSSARLRCGTMPSREPSFTGV